MIEILLLTLICVIGILVYYIYKCNTQIKQLRSQKKSEEVKKGYLTEQLIPFHKDFPYEPYKLRFLGMPIDYIYFGDNKIVFIEIKSGKSQLSPKQRNIKKLILNQQVLWDEIRI